MPISHGAFNRVVGLFDLQFKGMNRAGRGKFTHPLFMWNREIPLFGVSRSFYLKVFKETQQFKGLVPLNFCRSLNTTTCSRLNGF